MLIFCLMNSIGIMQGRLSPSYEGRFQFFPKDWSAEFSLAKKLGFDHIEWFLDRDEPGFDPVADIWGQESVLKEIDQTRQILPISSVDCGRYPLFGDQATQTINDFKILLPALAGRLKTSVISIPLLEDHAPKTKEQKEEARGIIKQIITIAEPLGLKVALETEMPADELAIFIDSFQSPMVGVCYDIGNAVTYGVDAPTEIRHLGKRILEVHCKDRRSGTTQSVLLGSGGADFPACFKALADIDYQGILTIQGWRGEDYLNDAVSQLAFVRSLLSKSHD